MSLKTKLEKDYQNLNKTIEQAAEDEIKAIREKTNALQKEAEKTGEAIQLSIDAGERKTSKKKS